VQSKGEYLLWFGIGLAMSFVLARYFGLEIGWNLVTGAPPGVLPAARKYAYCRTARFMVLRGFVCDLSRDDVRTRHYTGASGFVYTYFDIYWIAVAIAAARVGWGLCES
jgi:hypothetical protein